MNTTKISRYNPHNAVVGVWGVRSPVDSGVFTQEEIKIIQVGKLWVRLLVNYISQF